MEQEYFQHQQQIFFQQQGRHQFLSHQAQRPPQFFWAGGSGVYPGPVYEAPGIPGTMRPHVPALVPQPLAFQPFVQASPQDGGGYSTHPIYLLRMHKRISPRTDENDNGDPSESSDDEYADDASKMRAKQAQRKRQRMAYVAEVSGSQRQLDEASEDEDAASNAFDDDNGDASSRRSDADSDSDSDGQTIQERRELRQSYRELQQIFEDNHLEFVKPESNGILATLERANTNFEQGAEAALDSKVLTTAARLTIKRVQNMKLAGRTLNITDFLRRVRSRLLPNDENANIARPSENDVATEYGPLTAEPKSRNQKKRAPVRLNKDMFTMQRPQELKESDIHKQENETSKCVSGILKILKKKSPINFFEFVVNPASFGQSIENIFYVSFLIRDGLVVIDVEDGQPVIHYKGNSFDQDTSTSANKPQQQKQHIVELSYSMWEEIVEAYGLEESVIPTRKALDEYAGGSQAGKCGRLLTVLSLLPLHARVHVCGMGVLDAVLGASGAYDCFPQPHPRRPHAGFKARLCVFALGAGDLAFKKTYPALFGLFANNYLPNNVHIVGYARSPIALPDFRARISSKIKLPKTVSASTLDAFLAACTYVSGKYDDPKSFANLNSFVETLEAQAGGSTANPAGKTRIFYMALPPSVFIPASKGLKEGCYLPGGGKNRLIVEKPFGKDLESSEVLGKSLAAHWKEEEIYRIDHYLGKEMVKSLMVLRFANVMFGAIWNRNHINNIQITFKEKFGTDGRGGYFDEFGIIRDIMQNHLLQVLTVLAMERPVTLNAEDVRNEKVLVALRKSIPTILQVKVLRAINPISLDDTVLGQYTASADKKEPGYLDDPTVPHGSVTPTYAAHVLKIHNERWEGVPFILKAGKALNESKVEIRIQFNDVAGNLYPGAVRNELVIRLQPSEAVYMKMVNKEPGLSSAVHVTELDLSYEKRYKEAKIPDAYESLILDCLNGDHSNFVRNDELELAWKIFTPLLHKIEKERIQPELYEYGTRGPASAQEFITNHGFLRDESYKWVPPTAPHL
ncbi:Glucose-6-phosphate 1-dehydrogenase [Entophlyctis luteolus]|nr:Glucose-6-phosphate 1-dehydrogenase [Entophlyctis luteolus]